MILKPNPNKSAYQYIKDMLNNIKNPVIFELGVHWGEDTKRIMNLCKSPPNYHGFEPDPRNLKIIKEKKFPHKLNLVEGAVGAEDNEISLYLSDGIHPNNGNRMTGANSIRIPKVVKEKHNWIKFDNQIKVNCFTLDKYCNENNIDHIDLMWCDIQGAEYDMISGAMNIMSKTKYALLEFSNVELYEGQKTLDEYMELLSQTGNWEILNTYKIDVLIQNKSAL